MRIFCAMRHSMDPSQFYGSLWADEFLPALRELGHEVVETRVDLLPASKFMHIGTAFTREEDEVRSRITDQILEEVRAAHKREGVDLFLCYFYNSHFHPDGFAVLRRMGIPSVNFYCNSTYQLELVSSISRNVDFSWHTEREARSRYIELGANPICVQMGANPSRCRPIPGLERESKACFVGQRYADRDKWLAALAEADVPLTIFGSGWLPEEPGGQSISHEPIYLGRRNERPGSLHSYGRLAVRSIFDEGIAGGLRRLAFQLGHRRTGKKLRRGLVRFARGRAHDLAWVASAHEVFLNFSNVWADGRPGSRLIPHVRLRDFEGPMCRTCYLTAHTDEICELYDVGVEIDTYRTEAELIDKVKFYLSRADSAERLRSSGHDRAIRDHTWTHRFSELFAKLNLGTTGSK